MNVTVIGTGYVGLVTGTVFADLGNDVICVDIDPKKVKMLRGGESPIYEPGLEEMLKRNIKQKRLTFTESIEDGIKDAEVVFIAVGTPPIETEDSSDPSNGGTDLSQVRAVARSIGLAIDHPMTIVNKSTVPVGTGDIVKEAIEKNQTGNVSFNVLSNPEFLREGSAIADCLKPDRIVIGAPNEDAAKPLKELYSPLGAQVLVTDVKSAEIIKYASNAFLATKISFINAIADLCESSGADIAQVAGGMGMDERIGASFLNAGIGYGGSCFPKDTQSLIHTFGQFNEENPLLKAVVAINSSRVDRMLKRMEKRFGKLEGLTIAILGLAFKPDTDDLREARSVDIIRHLLGSGSKIRAYDPVAMPAMKLHYPDIADQIEFCDDAYDVAHDADALVIVTEWRQFIQLNLEKLKKTMKQPIIFDGRNIYSPDELKELEFEYFSVGRGS